MIFTAVLGIIKNTDVYKEALSRAQSSPGVIQGLVFLATKLALNYSCRYAEWEGGVISQLKPG
jgi:hypothetical protein